MAGLLGRFDPNTTDFNALAMQMRGPEVRFTPPEPQQFRSPVGGADIPSGRGPFGFNDLFRQLRSQNFVDQLPFLTQRNRLVGAFEIVSRIISSCGRLPVHRFCCTSAAEFPDRYQH